MRFKSDTIWHDLFEAGVILKALNALWETVGGILFFSVGPRWIEMISGRVTLMHRYLHPISHNTDIFVSGYLLVHGIVNGFLAYNLFRNRLWAYPFAMAFNALALIYEVYRLTHTHSLLLLAVTLFDPIFILLTWHEYQRVLESRKNRADSHR